MEEQERMEADTKTNEWINIRKKGHEVSTEGLQGRSRLGRWVSGETGRESRKREKTRSINYSTLEVTGLKSRM